MNAKQYFKKLYPRLNFEAIVLSLLHGLTIGFTCGFISAFVSWLTSFKGGMWLSIGIILFTTAITAIVFYFARFKPQAYRSAKRIDALGLEERMITMLELDGDTSVISELQRKDAQRHLDSVEKSSLKINVASKLWIVLIVSAILSVGMITIDQLGVAGIVPNPDDFVQEFPVAVTYEAEDGGYIEGDADQLVEFGGNADTVIAVANEGYEFIEWDDGYPYPERTDLSIKEDLIFVAIFEPVEGDETDGDGSDRPTDNPDEQTDPNRGESDDQNPSGSVGGKYEEANQVIDGKTYYREVLEMYRDFLAERLEEDGDELTDEERAVIEAYLGIV